MPLYECRCERCELSTYLVLASDGDVGVAGGCEPCPEQALCLSNGSIIALLGTYLLVGQSAGLVSTTDCSWQACVDGANCDSATPCQY